MRSFHTYNKVANLFLYCNRIYSKFELECMCILTSLPITKRTRIENILILQIFQLLIDYKSCLQSLKSRLINYNKQKYGISVMLFPVRHINYLKWLCLSIT